MDKEKRIYERGSISIEGRKIKEVGKFKPDEKPEEVIDATGKIVMPGLICSHTCFHRILFRAAPIHVDPAFDFFQILKRIWWQLDDQLIRGDDYVSSLAACLQFVKTGTTSIVNTYSGTSSAGRSLDRIASAVNKAGLRGIIGLEATERNTVAEGSRGMKENIRFIERLRGKKGKKRVYGMISLHDTFTVSDELLHYAKRMSKRYDVPLAISTAEGAVELYHILERYGKRTVERLYELGVLSPRTLLFHCVHLNDKEISLIKELNAKVAHDPMGNVLNGGGIARVPKMLDKGISVGLGNGGYIFDGFENIRFAYLIHKALAGSHRSITPMEALEMATTKGAEVYGWKDKLGSIEPGMLADIIILDARSFTPLRQENVIDHVVNSITGQNVETVIVDGRVLMRDRNVITLQEDEVLEASKNSAEKLWRRVEAIRR